ncbi:MAG: molybdate ABC transporter substrate-binding protein [Pseudomonadota bacterium]
MKTRFQIKGLTLLFGIWSGIAAYADDRVTVFAAASLQGALDEIATDWDGPVDLSFGGSGTMARQVSLGAPADVLILANPDWMDWLAGRGIVDTGQSIDLLTNRLVLIGPEEATPLSDPSAQTLSNRLEDGRLAMGQHRAVPAGIYAKAWLKNLNAWETLSDRLAEVENVRLALALVARRETPLGIVYASDAQADPAVTVLYEVPPDMHPPILYPAVALTDPGQAFMAHLTSETAATIFKTHGLIPLPE